MAQPAMSETAAPQADAAASSTAPPPSAAEEIVEVEGQAVEGWRLELRADEELRSRVSLEPDESDVDARLYLGASAATPDEAFSGDLALGLWWDIDGLPDTGTPTGLSQVRQLDEPPLWFDVYALSAAYQSRGLLRAARVGRLSIDRGLPLLLDGASVELAPIARYLELFVYGGRSVHFFELDAGLFEDWVASVGVASRPLRDLRLELDYRFQWESTERIEGMIDHGYGLGAWYRLDDWARLRAYLRGIDDALAFAGGALQVQWPSQELGAELRVHAQTTELRELNELDNPFFLTLGPSRPYLRWKADAWKAFSSAFGTYSLHLGGDGRHLVDGGESPFNRDFGRLYAMAQAVDIVVDGPFAMLVLARHGERFDFAGHGVWAVTGSAGYQARAWRVEAGSAYDSYKYTYYQSVDELQDVLTLFADAQVRPFDLLSVRVRYAYERFAWDVHTLTFGLSQVF